MGVFMAHFASGEDDQIPRSWIRWLLSIAASTLAASLLHTMPGVSELINRSLPPVSTSSSYSRRLEGLKCCRVSCSSSSDCAHDLFCCPHQHVCMDSSTKMDSG